MGYKWFFGENRLELGGIRGYLGEVGMLVGFVLFTFVFRKKVVFLP
jgi:hypothetical protein